MRHLLDLNDLLEEELCSIYQAETKVLNFINEATLRLGKGPLLDWVNIYKTKVEAHVAMIRRIFFQLFLTIDTSDNAIIEKIIKEYEDSAKRTEDQAIKEEELLLTITYIIHHKIACYGSLYSHAKALKYWDETVGLYAAEKEEEEMAATLNFLKEKHHVFLNDWYIL